MKSIIIDFLFFFVFSPFWGLRGGFLADVLKVFYQEKAKHLCNNVVYFMS